MQVLSELANRIKENFLATIDERVLDNFIEPNAYPNADHSRDREPLIPKLLEQFQNKSCSIRYWLIQGDSGFGKTTLSYYLCRKLWLKYHEGDRMPLYIHLPQIHDIKNILTCHFKNIHCKKSDLAWLERQPLLLFLDGFDELAVAERINLYEANNWVNRDVKVFYTCRRAALQHVFVSEVFTGYETNKRQVFENYLLAPFDNYQLQDYVTKILKNPPQILVESSYWQEPKWRNAHTYLDWFEKLPGLKELIETPFLLSIAIQSMPGLITSAADQAAYITRAMLYKQFIDDWLNHQANRSIRQLLSPELRGIKGKLQSYLWVYSCNLANRLLQAGQINERNLQEEETLDVKLLEPIPDNQHPELMSLLQRYESDDRQYFSGAIEYDSELLPLPPVTDVKRKTILRNRRIALVRDGCILHTQGNEFRFIHKSIAEYLAAYSLFAGLRGEYEVSLKQAAGEKWHVGLNQQNLREEPEILDRFMEMAKGDESIQGLLSELIIKSRELGGLEIAAANAITLLNRLGTNFSGMDLSDIQIPGADLRSGNFHGTNFTGANLAGVWFHGAWLNEAKFSGAKLTGTAFGLSALMEHPNNIGALTHYQPTPIDEQEPDGYWLSGCADGYVYMWSARRYELIEKFNHGSGIFKSSNVHSLAVHAQTRMMASSGEDKCIRLWDLSKKKYVRTLKEYIGTSISFDPKGQYLASESDNHTIRLCDVKSGKLVRVLEGHENYVLSISYHPKGHQLASGDRDKIIRLWDIESGKTIRALKGHTDYISDVRYHPHGHQLASSSNDTTIRLWDIESGKTIRVLKGHTNCVIAICYHPEGDQLASGCNDTIRLWNVESGKTVQVFEEHNRYLHSVCYHPHGHQLASSDVTTIRMWNLESGKKLGVLEGHKNDISTISYHPNGHQFATGGKDQTIQFWDVATGKKIRVFERYDFLVSLPIKYYSVSYHPQGHQLASNDGAIIRLWDIESGQKVQELERHRTNVTTVSYHPLGNQIASASEEGSVKLWDVASGKSVVLQGHTENVITLDYHPEGNQLATGSNDHTIRLWNALIGQFVRVLEGHKNAVNSVNYHPKGHQLASGSQDKTIRLWDIESGKTVRVLEGHTLEITTVNYHPEGQQLASGSKDHSIRLWDLKSGTCLKVMFFNNAVLKMAFHPHGTYLTVGYNKNIAQFQYEMPINNTQDLPKLRLLWRTGDESQFCHVDITQAIDCISATKRLMSSFQSIGNPAHPATLYQPWFELFKPIPGTASCLQQSALVETYKKLTITENRWVVSIARQLKDGAPSSSFWGSSSSSNSLHTFLIIEGILQQRRFVIRADLTSPNRKNVVISLKPIDDIEIFKESVKTFEAQQWDIPSEIGRLLLRNIREDQRKTLLYSQNGGGGVQLDNDYFSCVSWSMKQLRQLDEPTIVIHDKWYHFLVVLPEDATTATKSSSTL